MNLVDLLKQQVAKYTPLEDYFDFLKPKQMTEAEIVGQLDTANRPYQTQAVQPSPTTSPSPSPVPGAIQGGTDFAMDYIRSQTPQGASLENYYPALGNQGFVSGVEDADKQRQGLANLLLLQSFFESTLGKGGQGYFGAKPQGQTANFDDPIQALNYQLSPNVLGGGANPNMNILNTNAPLTLEDIKRLYASYNPEGAYLENLLGALGG